MEGDRICDTCYKSLREHAAPGSLPNSTSHHELWSGTRIGQPADDGAVLLSLEEVDSGVEDEGDLPIQSSSSPWANAATAISKLQKSAPARKSDTRASGASGSMAAAKGGVGAKASIAMLQKALDLTAGEDDDLLESDEDNAVNHKYFCRPPTSFLECS